MNNNLELDEIDNKIIELVNQGLVYSEISNIIGISKNELIKRINKIKNKRENEQRKQVEDEMDDIEKQIIKYMKKGLTQKEMAERIGVTQPAIGYRIKKIEKQYGIILKLKVNHNQKMESKNKDNEIIEMIKQGLSFQQVANNLGISKQAVSQRVKNIEQTHKVKLPRKKISGKPPKTEIDSIDIQIIEFLNQGLLQYEIAKILNLSHQTISMRVKKIEHIEQIELPKNNFKLFTEKELDELDLRIIELVNQGLTQKQISNELGMSQASISNKIRRIEEMYGTKIRKSKSKNTIDGVPRKEFAKMIVQLIHSKNATVNQVKQIAQYYGVNIDKELDAINENER